MRTLQNRVAECKLDEPTLKGFFADHKCPLCIHPSLKRGFTVDSMLFNCNTREAHVTRGPVCAGRWQTFRFDR